MSNTVTVTQANLYNIYNPRVINPHIIMSYYVSGRMTREDCITALKALKCENLEIVEELDTAEAERERTLAHYGYPGEKITVSVEPDGILTLYKYNLQSIHSQDYAI